MLRTADELGKMKRNYLNLPAKILAILYLVFISLFAFDTPILSVGFLIHLLPTLILAGCLVFAWFKPKVGGILFVVAGLGTVVVFNTYRELISFVVISGIPILVGILFGFSKKK